MNAKHEQKQLQTFDLTVAVQSHETWWPSNSTNQISRRAGVAATIYPRGKLMLNPSKDREQPCSSCLFPEQDMIRSQSDCYEHAGGALLTMISQAASHQHEWQQFTLLHSNSNHPSLLQVFPTQLPQRTTRQAAEQQAMVSAINIYQSDLY